MTQPFEEGHTVHRYDNELSHLLMIGLQMAGLVQDQTEAALDALRKRDLAQARRVIDLDNEVDNLELRADEESASVIARRGPMARDLRIIMGVSKAVTDLERIGDEAARICHLCLAMYDSEQSNPSEHLMRDIGTMGRLAKNMLRKAVGALDRLDPAVSEELGRSQAELSEEFEAALRRLTTYVMEDHRNLGHVISIVLITKALERIGDHSKNIAEHVVYLVEGRDVRHQPHGTDEDSTAHPGSRQSSQSG